VNLLSSSLCKVAFYEACRLELKIAISHSLTSLQLQECDLTEWMCRRFEVHKFYPVNIQMSPKAPAKKIHLHRQG
jgi:hypothetical protein